MKLQSGSVSKVPPLLGHPEESRTKVSKKRRCCQILGGALLFLLVLYCALSAGYAVYDGANTLYRYVNWDNQCVSFSRDYIPATGDIEVESKCKIELVESIPQGLTYEEPVKTKRTYETFEDLILMAQHRIQIASSYWSLRGRDTNSSANEEWTIDKGEKVFKLLVQAAVMRGVKIQIAQDLPKPGMPSLDTLELAKLDNVEVKSLNFTHLVGRGILHTKMMLVDDLHFYVGSNNFDWRSFTQVKEMGVQVTHCPKLGDDMRKIFEIYWAVGGQNKTVPKKWPAELDTNINRDSPLKVDSMDLSVYMSATPYQLTTCHRDHDHYAIRSAIDSAEKFVYVAVMDYFPTTIYGKGRPEFWPFIDDRLRTVAIEKGIEIRLLLSKWPHTRDNQKNYLQSLTALNQPRENVSIKGRWFTVPANASQALIPYARVNHNKYIVTDKEALVMTSNWSADYFLYTGGIGFGFSPSLNATGNKNMLTQLQQIFLRDWNSQYASQDV